MISACSQRQPVLQPFQMAGEFLVAGLGLLGKLREPKMSGNAQALARTLGAEPDDGVCE
jgi:hypothetical protein